MRWQGRRQSGNVQDRRGARPMMIGGGIGGVVLILAALIFGVDPGAVLQGPAGDTPPAAEGPGGGGPPTDELGQFVSVVLAETEDTWNRVFAENDADYPEPTLVLFTDAVQSACGMAGSAVGPFYCPLNGNLYIDLSFYRALRDRLGAPGDFAQAYVIAHEVGHHVQNVLGIAERVRREQSSVSPEAANQLSVRLELQADCLAGVWAHDADRKGILEPGDVEEAMNAAAAIGDDALQRRGQGYVTPESFTHGTSEQRARWFRRGAESGDVNACDTFSGQSI